MGNKLPPANGTSGKQLGSESRSLNSHPSSVPSSEGAGENP